MLGFLREKAPFNSVVVKSDHVSMKAMRVYTYPRVTRTRTCTYMYAAYGYGSTDTEKYEQKDKQAGNEQLFNTLVTL